MIIARIQSIMIRLFGKYYVQCRGDHIQWITINENEMLPKSILKKYSYYIPYLWEHESLYNLLTPDYIEDFYGILNKEWLARYADKIPYAYLIKLFDEDYYIREVVTMNQYIPIFIFEEVYTKFTYDCWRNMIGLQDNITFDYMREIVNSDKMRNIQIVRHIRGDVCVYTTYKMVLHLIDEMEEYVDKFVSCVDEYNQEGDTDR